MLFSPIYRAITHGISHVVGDVAVGKLADLIMWNPATFGVRPEQVIKGGVIAWSQVSGLGIGSTRCQEAVRCAESLHSFWGFGAPSTCQIGDPNGVSSRTCLASSDSDNNIC